MQNPNEIPEEVHLAADTIYQHAVKSRWSSGWQFRNVADRAALIKATERIKELEKALDELEEIIGKNRYRP